MKFNFEEKQKQADEVLGALNNIILLMDEQALLLCHDDVKLIRATIKHAIANEMTLEALKERMLNAVLDQKKEANEGRKKQNNETSQGIGRQLNIDFPASSRTVDARAHYRG